MRQYTIDLFKRIEAYWFAVAGVFAIAVFVNALLTPGTVENPAGLAGLSAGMLAMSAAAIVIAEAAYAQQLALRRMPGLFLGLVTLAGAYLWTAAEAGAHPADPAFSGLIGSIWIMCAVITLGFAVFLLLTKSGGRRGPPGPIGS